MLINLKLGDVVKLKKKHPCGSDEWLVDRLGTDIGLTCTGCRHHILIERGVLEHRLSRKASPGRPRLAR